MSVVEEKEPTIEIPPHGIFRRFIETAAELVARYGDIMEQEIFGVMNPSHPYYAYYKRTVYSLQMENGMSFNDIAQSIVTTRRAAPCSLLLASMKIVLQHELQLEDLPQVLQEKCQAGLYSPQDPVPGNLKPYGEFLYGLLLDAYGGDDFTVD